MHTSQEFHANPIGLFVDAEKVADRRGRRAPFAEIHRRAMAGEFAPAQAPVEIPTRGLRAMRLVTYEDGGAPQAGVLIGEEIVPVAALDAPADRCAACSSALDAAGLAGSASAPPRATSGSRSPACACSRRFRTPRRSSAWA